MTKYRLPVLGMLIVLALLVAGCSITSNDTTLAEPSTTASLPASESATSVDLQQSPTPSMTFPHATDPASTTITSETPETGPNSLENTLPKPQNTLEDRDYTWNQLLARDAIRPIYEPEFTDVSSAPYDDDELVIGVEINGEAKAYPIGPLNSREMVNDTVGGTPVLVTW